VLGFRLSHSGNGSVHQRAAANNDEITIGKAPECGVVIDGDGYVSRCHCRLVREEGRVFVEDLGSSNGTFLRVQKRLELEVGDELLVGTNVFRLEPTDGASPQNGTPPSPPR